MHKLIDLLICHLADTFITIKLQKMYYNPLARELLPNVSRQLQYMYNFSIYILFVCLFICTFIHSFIYPMQPSALYDIQ